MDNRELDAAIAEKVMGWQIHPRNTAHWMRNGDDEIGYKVMSQVGVWKPSSDISAAFQVAETLEKRFECTVNIQIRPRRGGIDKVWTGERWEHKRYAVTIEGGNLGYDNFNCSFTVYDDSLCMAICQSVLKAVGVEV